jgi:hypothetical protein
MPTFRRFSTAIVALIAIAGSLAAQSAPADQQAPAQEAPVVVSAAPAPAVTVTTDPAVSLIPLAQEASVGVHMTPTNAPAPYAPPRRREQVGHNVMLMIVGGAALVTGAIITGSASTDTGRGVGDAVMISGAVVGIIGLIRYLQ